MIPQGRIMVLRVGCSDNEGSCYGQFGKGVAELVSGPAGY